MLKGLITFAFLFYTLTLIAQTGKSDGKLIEVPVKNAGNDSVPDTLILSKSLDQRRVDEYSRHYRIGSYTGDSLFDTAFIYPQYINPVTGNIIPKGDLYKGYLNQAPNELKSDANLPFPATYEEFKKEFLELEVEDPIANLRMILPSPKEMRNLAYPHGGIVVQGPVSFLYDIFSKEARSNKIYAGLMKKDRVSARYNFALITKLTGMTDKDEIQKFMDFCALQIQFILNSSDYELYAVIMDCYSEFCKTEADTVVCGE